MSTAGARELQRLDAGGHATLPVPEAQTTVIHSYRTACKTVGQPPGFADFLRGTMALFQRAQDLKFLLHVDLAHHPIGEFLEGTADTPMDGADDDVHEFFNENQGRLEPFLRDLRTGGIYRLTTHNFPVEPVGQPCKEFIKKLLTPTATYARYLNTITRHLRLDGRYGVVHVRTGDRSASFSNQQFKDTAPASCVADIVGRVGDYITTQVSQVWGGDVLIVSDNSLVSEGLARRCSLKRLEGASVHLGWPASPAAIRHTLTEFFLMTRAATIHQWSVYGGSGFSEIVAKIYDIPLYKVT